MGPEMATMTLAVEGGGEDRSDGGWGGDEGYVLLNIRGGDPSLGFFSGREEPPGSDAIFFFLLTAC